MACTVALGSRWSLSRVDGRDACLGRAGGRVLIGYVRVGAYGARQEDQERCEHDDGVLSWRC